MDWHNNTYYQVKDYFKTNLESGLTQQEALFRLRQKGENVLREKKKQSIGLKFLNQFSDFMVIVLIIAAAISFVASLMQGNADFVDPIIILAIVIINAVIGVIQESKAESAIAALQKITAPETVVIRDAVKQKIPSKQVVAGDVILLESGDLVPADARLCEVINLKIDESTLTGESIPVEKDGAALLPIKTIIGDQKNMVFSGSIVVAGRAKAIVTATGMDSEIGKIAGLINQEDTLMTPLQKRLADTGKILGIAALLICGFIFVLGLVQNVPALDTFMLSVSLAVAAIPEGLPAIVTIVLAFGVQKMAKKNAIIRRLPAVETLGSATVICSDKTGTLTQNKMTVTQVNDLNGALNLSGDSSNNALTEILSLGTLCNNSSLERENGVLITKGDPTESAIVEACALQGITKKGLEEEHKRIKEIPFDSNRKMMTTVHTSQSGFKVVSKGASDVLIKRCSYYKVKGKVVALTADKIREIDQQLYDMANKSLRVLGVAYKDVAMPQSDREYESNLIFCGLIGMIDPPREDAKSAVLLCKRAGIKPVMITGDHVITACAIAKQLGIMKKGQTALTGERIDKLDNKELAKEVSKCFVFARVSPEHKVRIVKAYQRRGEVVAMTGDGVNDAPALKAADIGCAMGKYGTEVAKSAADMILTDDKFSTIVSAVREGRGIYDNIRKSVHFLLSCNIGEILTIFIASIFSLPTPLLPIQLLWVNLVTDSLPAISLGLEPTEDDVMYRKPVSPKKSLFGDGLLMDIFLEGCMIGAFALLAFSIGRTIFDVTAVPYVGRTMAFAVLSLSQLVHAFNVRSSHSMLQVGLFGNKRLCISFVICAAMQVSVITIKPLSVIFKTIPLNLFQWVCVIALSILPLFVIEIVKSIITGGRKKAINGFEVN